MNRCSMPSPPFGPCNLPPMVRGVRRPWTGVPLLVVALVVGAACQSPPESSRSDSASQAAPRNRAPKAVSPAERLDPTIAVEWYQLVGLPQFQVQGSSQRLVEMVGTRPRLEVEALTSEQGTVALKFVERATPKNRWGAVMTPAQRRVFGAFAADPSMGEWLIVFTDVVVTGGIDPIPVTGYRWRRADVEAYADCGIPSSGLDTCTHLFYATPQMVLLPPKSIGGAGGARGS